MITEKIFDASTKMCKGFPKIEKLGAVSPFGQPDNFVWNGRVYRLETTDPTNGVDRYAPIIASIRDRETGEIISRFGHSCYYYSLYQEEDTVYVIAVKSVPPLFGGDTLVLYESKNLVCWTCRELLHLPDFWVHYTSLTKGPHGYVLCLLTRKPEKYVESYNFTCFFATSEDMKHWAVMDADHRFPQNRYIGSPYIRYYDGYYYLLAAQRFPCLRYGVYAFRTADFETWEHGLYNPILMPGEEDRRLSLYAYDFSPEQIREMRTGFISSNSDIHLCEWKGQTLFSYGVGNQLGFAYSAEAVYNGTPEQFLLANFE